MIPYALELGNVLQSRSWEITLALFSDTEETFHLLLFVGIRKAERYPSPNEPCPAVGKQGVSIRRQVLQSAH